MDNTVIAVITIVIVIVAPNFLVPTELYGKAKY